MNDTANMAADLWHALSDDLRTFVRSRVRNESDADDLLQDVFVSVVEKIGSLRQVDRIHSWIYQIARNAIADFYRRRAPRSNDAVEDVADPQGVDKGTNHNRVWEPGYR